LSRAENLSVGIYWNGELTDWRGMLIGWSRELIS
jgi:hypothetical protein